MDKSDNIAGAIVAIGLIEEAINKLNDADRRLRQCSTMFLHPSNYPIDAVPSLREMQKRLAGFLG